jgi:hypothetical protein
MRDHEQLGTISNSDIGGTARERGSNSGKIGTSAATTGECDRGIQQRFSRILQLRSTVYRSVYCFFIHARHLVGSLLLAVFSSRRVDKSPGNNERAIGSLGRRRFDCSSGADSYGKEVDRPNKKGFGSWRRVRDGQRKKEESLAIPKKGRRPVMPTCIIQPDDDYRIKFNAIPRGRRVRVTVESNNPIYAYLVEREDIDDFDAEQDFLTLAGEDRDKLKHKLTAFIPRGTAWYLLMVNLNDDPVAVYWHAYYLRY